MSTKMKQKELKKIADEVLYGSTCFLGGLAFGMCVGYSSEDYNHTRNLLLTLAVPGTIFPLFDKITNRDNYDIAKRTACISSGFLIGQYLAPTINQIISK